MGHLWTHSLKYVKIPSKIARLGRILEEIMITPTEYFEKYLSWKRSDSGLRSAKATYAPFSSLDLETLTAEAEAGTPGAQEELGERYLFGLSDLKVDPQRAKELFTKAALGLFGSGWVWLVMDKEHKLSIVQESNAGNPLTKGLTPVMVIDVWEHAYYIDYRNRRAAYIEAFWKVVDWNVVAGRI